MEQEPRFRVGDFTRKGIKSNFCPLASARGSGMRHDELLECRRRGLAWFFHTVTSRTSQFSHLTRGGMTDCLGQDSSASSSRALPHSLIHSVPFSCSISPEPQSSPDTSSLPMPVVVPKTSWCSVRQKIESGCSCSSWKVPRLRWGWET